MLGKHWGHCVLTWPVSVVASSGTDPYTPTVATADEPFSTPVFDYMVWTLQEVECLLPLHLGLRCPEVPVGIVMVPKGGPETVLRAGWGGGWEEAVEGP